MTDVNPCLAAALSYATKAELFIFPAKPGEKKSRVKREFTADGKNWGMTYNPETIKNYWRKWPDSNVCIVTGEINNLFVVETDTAEGHDADGETSLKNLIAANNNDWPETKKTRSPTGSIHYYFEWPAGNVNIINSAGKLGPGIDVRGNGGMVIAPPSIRSPQDSRQYEWLNPNQTIAKAPAWLVNKLAEKIEARPNIDPEETDFDKIIKAMTLIPNKPGTVWEVTSRKDGVVTTREGWDGWNTIGMALHRATGGSDAGFKVFDEWCRQNLVKYKNGKYIRYSWYGRWIKSPPKRIGARTLYAIADDLEPKWEEVWNFEHHEERTEQRIETAKAASKYEIKLRESTYDEVDETEQYLIASGAGIYVYGTRLVRPITIQVEAVQGKLTKIAQLHDVTPHWLQQTAAKVIRYFKYDVRAKKWHACKPPMDIFNKLLDNVGQWTFPEITGVISTPTMRPDGSVLSNPGYDAATRLLLVNPPQLPNLKDKPTRDDALHSLAIIEDLLTEFPFADDVARAVALSAIITPVVRGAFPVAPMHVNRAPVMASGKSYLFDIVAAIAIGQYMPVMAAGQTSEETEKRLGAALLGGHNLINLDNVNGELGGDALCQIIERPIVNIRVLGQSEIRTIEARGTTVYATGNNIILVGDITRRALITILDPKIERPELREFKKDPVAMIFADRAKYITAALTVSRAYIAAGLPDKAKRLGSFGSWSDVVRSALLWLGKSDPVDSMDLIRQEDPERTMLRELLTEWASIMGTGYINRVTLSTVIEECQEHGESGYDQFTFKWPDFNLAVCRIASIYGKPPETLRLSRKLRTVKGRVIDGLSLQAEIKEKTGSVWWVQEDNNPGRPGLRSEPKIVKPRFGDR